MTTILLSKNERNWKTLFIRTIQSGFERYGIVVGRHPFSFIGATLVISSILTSGFYYVSFSDDVRFGYTPDDAPSRHEMAIYQEFFEIENGPYVLWILIEARDGGSLLRENYLNGVEEFQHFFADFSISTSSIANYSYKTACKLQCNLNFAVTAFKDGLTTQRNRITQGKPLSRSFDLTYPKMKFLNTQIDISGNFFGLIHNESIKNVTGTSIDSCSLIVLWYAGDRGNINMRKAETKWEFALFNYVNNMNNSYIKVNIVGDQIGNEEVMRAAKGLTPYLLIGWLLMFVFISFVIIFTAVYYCRMNIFTPFIVFVALLAPILAITSTFGFTCMIGQPINALMMVIPFLIVAIGVDDTFLMLHCFQRFCQEQANVIEDQTETDALCHTIADKMAFMLREIGPSIFITSLTNCLAFAIGVLAPMPQIRAFCLVASIAMFMDFLFQLTLLAPVVILSERQAEKQVVGPKWPRLNWNLAMVPNKYSMLLTTRKAQILTLILLAAGWSFGFVGIIQMKTSFHPEKTLPPDSPVRNNLKTAETIVMKERYVLLFFVNKPPNITDNYEYNQFKTMVHELEMIPEALGPDFTTLWLTEYESWVMESKQALVIFGIKDDDPLSYDDVPFFMEGEERKQFRGMVKWQQKGQTTTVDSFIFYVAFANMSIWLDKVVLMVEIRQLLNKYPQFNTTMWEMDTSWFDLSLVTKKLTFASIYVTMACMTIVCALFIPNLFCVFIAICSIGSICMVTLGLLSWWNIDLDPLTMINMLPTIGFSIDYTAHIVYHYHHNVALYQSKAERLLATLNAVATPMLQAGMSTLICISLIGFSNVYVFTIFVKTTVLVVSLGLIHGLFIVPTLLTLSPDWLTGGTKLQVKQAEEQPLKVIQ